MLNILRRAMPILVSVACGTSSFAVNLVANGSFELPMVDANLDDGNGVYWYTRQNDPADWIVAHSGTAILRNRAGGWVGTDGEQFINLESGYNESVSQTLSTVVGQMYKISFDLAADDYGQNNLIDSCVGVSWEGTGVGLVTPTQSSVRSVNWDHIEIIVTATSSSSEFKLRDAFVGNSYRGPVLDNVKVESVPEPATLCVLGLAVTAAIRRKRK
ncbi:MAG: DUF642 domain-containing protein [Armatimonadetes bacterium]|nr:DUF642 domain-containing protein [Armatimonadota bacterium]